MFSIFALWVRKDLFRGPRIDEKALFHDTYIIADVLDDGEIMRNEKDREPKVAAKVPEEIQDSRLDRHVKRRNRLIAHNELRV